MAKQEKINFSGFTTIKFGLIIVVLFFAFNSRSQQGEPFKDPRDGKVYKTIKIGTQTWMAENLNYRTSKDSWYFNNDSIRNQKNGRQYTWEAAKLACPPGWHLASDAEWTTLANFLGGENVAGGKIKEAGTTNWHDPNLGADNSSGFTALPGGYCYGPGNCKGNGGNCYFWTSTFDNNSYRVWIRTVYSVSPVLKRFLNHASSGFYARCIKD